MTHNLPSSDSSRVLLDDLHAHTARIEKALENLTMGTIDDLYGLDEQIETLCIALENAPPEIAHQARDPMMYMIARLDDLERGLRTRYDGLSGAG